MTTLNQLAYSIAELMQKQDDAGYIELLKYNIGLMRSILLRRDGARNTRQSSVFEQDLGMVYLEQIDSAEDTNVMPGKIVKRSTKLIPAPVRGKTPRPFRFVGTPDKFNELDYIPENRLRYMANRSFTPNRPAYYYREGRLYFVGYEGMVVNVRGIFEDPIAIMEDFYNLSADTIPNEPYPISGDMAVQIQDAIINQQLKLVQLPTDEQEIDVDK